MFRKKILTFSLTYRWKFTRKCGFDRMIIPFDRMIIPIKEPIDRKYHVPEEPIDIKIISIKEEH